MKINLLFLISTLFFAACASTPKADNDKLKLMSELRYGSETVSAASGLAHDKIWSYIIADDERFLYAFTYKVCALNPVCIHKKENVQTYPLNSKELPSDPKERSQAKADYEALIKISSGSKNYLVVIPSGSKDSRVLGARFDLDKKTYRTLNFAPLYKHLKEKIVGLNIEGVADTGAEIILFQRGNSQGAQSAMIYLNKLQVLAELELLKLSEKSIMKIVPVDLGQVSGTSLGFSDAQYTEHGIYFIATAEATDSASKNGEIIGTQLGLMESDGKIKKLAWFAGEKFEGIQVSIYDGKTIVHLVNDPDDRNVAAKMWSYSL